MSNDTTHIYSNKTINIFTPLHTSQNTQANTNQSTTQYRNTSLIHHKLPHTSITTSEWWNKVSNINKEYLEQKMNECMSNDATHAPIKLLTHLLQYTLTKMQKTNI